jgi:hypothetical protein
MTHASGFPELNLRPLPLGCDLFFDKKTQHNDVQEEREASARV